jgi:sec-independent protein translocase protein TatC
MRMVPRRSRGAEAGPRRRRLFRRRTLEQRGTMTILEHLEELRSRLIWVFIAVAVAAIAGWLLFDGVIETLLDPARPYLTDLTAGKLIVTSPVEAFTLRLKVAMYIGFGIAFPFVLFHVWRFVSPGLHRSERRYAVPFIASGFLLFALGVWFAWFTMPQAFKYLISPSITGANVRPFLSAKSYIDFSLLYLAAFGLAFEFPVAIMFMSLVGAVSSRQMARYRRHVFMGIAAASAVLTPSVDWFTMTALTAALYVLYESCIWLTRLLRR